MTEIWKERRSLLLNLALEEIDAGLPIQQMSMRKLAKMAGFAHTNVYNFFPSLGNLQWEILREALDRMEHACFHTEERVTPHQLIDCYVHFALNHPGWYRLIFLDPLDQDAKPEEIGFVRDKAPRFHEVMQAHYPASPRPIIIQVSGLLHTFVHGWIVQRLTQRESTKFDDQTRQKLWADINMLFSLLEVRNKIDNEENKESTSKVKVNRTDLEAQAAREL
jgi:AcrR family transcriptional regulator